MITLALIPNDFYGKGKDFEDVLHLCNEEGIAHVELASLWGKSVLDLDDGETSRAKGVLEAHGISVAAIQTQLLKTFPGPGKSYLGRIVSALYGPLGKGNMHGDHDFNVSRAGKVFTLAKEFNAPCIITYSFFTSRQHVDDNLWQRLAADYAPIAREAEKQGKILAVECENDCMVSDVSQYCKLFDMVGSPALKANLDLANLLVARGKFTRVEFDAIKDRLVYLHLKDCASTSWSMPRLLIAGSRVFGEGVVPWREVLPWLVEAKFDGVLSIEPHFFTGNRFEAGRRCVRAVKAILNELGVVWH